MKMNIRRLLAIIIILGILSCRSTADRKRISVFNDCKPQKFEVISEKDLVKDWFYLPVTHGGDAFNPVFIPFNYKCDSENPDTMQMLVFPTLLAFKFDFVPDNNSTRHPAFVYARDFNARKLKYTDQPSQIAGYIKQWCATYAIGGDLNQGKNGYSGQMVVFDTTGKEVLRKQYSKSLPYFTLMGDMVRDWMLFADWPIPDQLLKELIRPMTNDMSNVTRYGKVFSVENRSRAEWEIYEDILKRDPDFAEVRYWYANQLGWSIGGHKNQQSSFGQSLASHLVLHALYAFDDKNCSDSHLVDVYRRQLSYAQRLYPEGHPHIIATMLFSTNITPTRIMDTLLAYAKKFTSSYPLLARLADEYQRANHLEKAIPLGISALYSGYLPASDEYAEVLRDLGKNFTTLGYIDEGDFCNRKSVIEYGSQEAPILDYAIGCNLRDRFYFAEASKYFMRSYINLKHQWWLLAGYMCLYEAGMAETARQWMQEKFKQPTNEYVRLIIRARDAMADGDLQGAQKLMDGMPFEKINLEVDWRIQVEAEIVKADIALLLGDKKLAYRCAMNSYFIDPRSRRTLYLAELSSPDDMEIGELVTVAAYMFPRQSYWQKKLAEIKKKGFKDLTEKKLRIIYNGISEWYDRVSDNRRAYIMNANPFYNEYMCLRMMDMDSRDDKIKSIDIYIKLSDELKGMFPNYTAHTRAFTMMLLNQLEPEDRAEWIEKF